MSGIAEVLLNLGYEVSGSDLNRSLTTRRLTRSGAKVRYGHKAENVGKAQVVVTSSAISRDNPEVVAAQQQGIPVIARAEMLAELMRLKYGIAVAGTHGKTTTTSLIASLLTDNQLDPTVIIGGRVRSLRSNARLGKGEFLVAEADESDGSFLLLHPTIAVVTNIDPEHLSHYKDYEELKKAFVRFGEAIPFYGAAIFCVDHPVTAKIAETFPRRLITYGLEKKADFMAKSIRFDGPTMRFNVFFQGKSLGEVQLKLPGRHNVANALAAIAVAHELGIPFTKVRHSLKHFKGIARRLEVLYQPSSQRVISRESSARGGPHGAPIIIDDYAHHPVEIVETLDSIKKSWKGYRIRAVFQPHRYTRTKELFKEFQASFADCHELIMTDIYAASEKPIVGITGRCLAEAIQVPQNVQYRSNFDEIVDYLWESRGARDLFVTLGAGNVWVIAKELAKRAKKAVPGPGSRIPSRKRQGSKHTNFFTTRDMGHGTKEFAYIQRGN